MSKVEPLIHELSSPGRIAFSLPELDVPVDISGLLPENATRETPPDLPEVSEVDVIRHYVRLSQLNYGVDLGVYPLGSCTMKYSPKINEDAARLPGFSEIHPYQPESTAQGALELMYWAQRFLAEIGGVDEVSLQPAAGAHGELTGLLVIKAFMESKGELRTKVIIPDSAHGTNPATAAVCGCHTVQVKSNARGGVDLDALRAVLDDDVLALMLTNPNTLGLFDENIHEIAALVHGVGGRLYYDGANLNAIMGMTRPGDAGFDVIHFNLHKTFSTPHGGGGPGSGPIGVSKEMTPFLPVPVVTYDGTKFALDYDRPQSIGRVKSFYGNFGVVVKAYTYIRSLGPDGLKQVSQDAVLNANYLMRRLQPYYDLPYDRHCMHEFVLSGRRQKQESGVRALDISKRILDYGMHPPTNYFPLIVDECLMVEPTETESKQSLDQFTDVMLKIADEAKRDPELLKSAPHCTPVRRLDEVLAAKRQELKWRLQDK